MLSCKEFDTKLQIDNFKMLEQEYQQTKKFFRELNEKFKCDDLEIKFPAFCSFNQHIMIKFPTYKIRVVNSEMTHDELYEILKGSGNYKIYEEPNVVMYPSLKPVKSTAIHCLEDNLNYNQNMAEKIEMKLKNININYQRCVSYGLYCIPIEVDEHGYLLVTKS